MNVEEEVIKVIRERQAKGIKFYGHRIRVNDGHNWLDEAIAEAADLLQYLIAAKIKQKENER